MKNANQTIQCLKLSTESFLSLMIKMVWFSGLPILLHARKKCKLYQKKNHSKSHIISTLCYYIIFYLNKLEIEGNLLKLITDIESILTANIILHSSMWNNNVLINKEPHIGWWTHKIIM